MRIGIIEILILGIIGLTVYFLVTRNRARQGAPPVGLSNTGGEHITTTDRFQALESIGRFLAAIGWVVVAISVVAGFVVARSASGFDRAGAIAGLAIGVLGAVQGLVVVGLGQLIQCVVSIENNSRLTATHSRLTSLALAAHDVSDNDMKTDSSV